MKRWVLDDERYERLKPYLAGLWGQVGASAKDTRLFLEAVFHVLRTGCPWRDLPECYGKWSTAYKRFNRWAVKGLWEAIFEVLCADADFEWLMLDSTVVRAHQHAAGAKGGSTSRHWEEAVAGLAQNYMRPVMVLEIQSAFFLPQGKKAILRKHCL
jgi:transposase